MATSSTPGTVKEWLPPSTESGINGKRALTWKPDLYANPDIMNSITALKVIAVHPHIFNHLHIAFGEVETFIRLFRTLT